MKTQLRKHFRRAYLFASCVITDEAYRSMDPLEQAAYALFVFNCRNPDVLETRRATRGTPFAFMYGTHPCKAYPMPRKAAK